MSIKMKRYIKKSLLIVPVLVMLVVLTFFIHLFHRYDETNFETVFEDSKYTVDMIAETVESFRDQGYEYDISSDIYETLIMENMVFLNKKPGVNLRMLDLEFKTVYEDKKIKEEYSVSLFSKESVHYNEVIHAMKNEPLGEIKIVNDDGDEAILYWRQIPSPPDSQHYLVLTVDKAKVLDNNLSGEFLIGIFIMCIVIMISLWDSVALRLKR